MPRGWVSDPRYDIRGIGNIRNSKARGDCVSAAHSVPEPAVGGAESSGASQGPGASTATVSLRCRDHAVLSAGDRPDARSRTRIVFKRSSVRVRVTDMRCGGNRRSRSAGERVDRVACARAPSAFARRQRQVIVAHGNRRRRAGGAAGPPTGPREMGLEVGGKASRSASRCAGAAVATLAPTIPRARSKRSAVSRMASWQPDARCDQRMCVIG